MAEQIRAIFTAATPKPARQDKLTQTKLREREIKEAHRAELRMQKEQRMEARKEQHTTLKEERLFHDTKRAQKDKREAAKREAHAQTGQMCEHGIWRCKICYPHKQGKPLHGSMA